MKYLLSAFVLIALCSCAAETKTYGSALSKHPAFLKLKPDGSYLIEQHFKYTVLETGRWWELETSLVALLPDDPAKQAQFARVGPIAAPRGYVIYPDLRAALQNHLVLVDRPTQSNDQAEGQTATSELRELIKALDKGPLSRDEYRALTAEPYSRGPFLEDGIANRAYFEGFQQAMDLRRNEPGQLAFVGENVLMSGTLRDAAFGAGYSAGMTGRYDQLSESEHKQIREEDRRFDLKRREEIEQFAQEATERAMLQFQEAFERAEDESK